jgi:2-oxoglutarate ferredoxin oxidoreductase subunit alpha
MEKSIFKDEITIVFSGEAGQGLNTLGNILVNLLKDEGFFVFQTSEFMSRIRGGNNSIAIRVSSKQVSAYSERIDIFIPLNINSTERFKDRISKDTFLIGEKGHVENEYQEFVYKFVEIPFYQLAKQINKPIYMNIIIIGFLSKLFEIDRKIIDDQLYKKFEKKGQHILSNVIAAEKEGEKAAGEFIGKDLLSISINRSEDVEKKYFLSGSETIGIGALAGGCDFISSYPMSPSTNVLTFLAQQANEFKIVVEQAEDEISAVNMACGSWYAGGRAMVTTSGGGFALMTEGVSLAGAIESPLVVHLAQRPGPATGLPTRTEQGDLNLALYSGHGEFPRVIFAPGDYKEGITITAHAFDMADRFQLPAFILTDQYYLDSSCCTNVDSPNKKTKKNIIKTKPDYKRYEMTDNGISPRGIPGNGKGIVCVDSDEHDESGRITEDAFIRKLMVEKRRKKMYLLHENCIPPKLIGNKKYLYLIVSWGSTFHIIEEALERIKNNKISALHFCQIHPLHYLTKKYLEKAKKRIIIEGNATSQFGTLIEMRTGQKFDHKILKYNGFQFSVEEIIGEIKKIL